MLARGDALLHAQAIDAEGKPRDMFSDWPPPGASHECRTGLDVPPGREVFS